MNDTTASAPVEAKAPHWTFAMLHAAQSIGDSLEAALGSVGLSMAKQSALSQLAQAGEPLTLSELAARLSCVRSNITQLVDRLEADGFVKRIDDASDRRSVRAALTALGRKKQVAGAEEVERVQAEITRRLSAVERRALEAALGSLA